MSDDLGTDDSLSLSLALRLNQLCNRFEAAWQAAGCGAEGSESTPRPPRIEEFLNLVPEADRTSLLRELILLEIHYREARGERCQAAEYRERFAALDQEWLARALTASQAAKPDMPSPSAEEPKQTASEGDSGHREDEALVLPAITDSPGSRIGPYKLLQQLGEGGMGIVFMAEQQQPVRRKVALKVLKPGMDTRQVIARFEAERQALALMDHPNIAKVLDAGETASGRPYFVMELVRGVPITDYCDQNRLTTRERLELFVHVCQAVQHAHHKGIIHRDIKPSNVLVTLHDDVPVRQGDRLRHRQGAGPAADRQDAVHRLRANDRHAACT